ncbi:MAG: tetratricopeptide repeat protein [Pirellula sp.]
MARSGIGRIFTILKGIAFAPLRAAGELLGLLFGSKSSQMTPELAEKKSKRRRALITSLPALLGFLSSLGLMAWGATSQTRIANQYAEKLSIATSQTDRIQADRIALRVFQNGVRSLPDASLNYCTFIASQKDLFQANSIIEKLAPNDTPGFAPAHAQRAIAYSNLLSQGASDRYLPTLQWHLKQAGDPTTEALSMAWANYFRLTGQIDQSIQALEMAAKSEPKHWFSIADLYVLDGKPELARRSLASAIGSYRLRLGKDPLSTVDRLQLAMAQARSGEYQQAAETLKSGLDLMPQNQEFLKARSQIEIIGLEQSLKQAPKLTQKLRIAKEIVSKSEDPSRIYQSSLELYQQATTAEDKVLVEQFLIESLQERGPNASLGFAQSAILLQQGNVAQSIEKLQANIDAFPNHGYSLNNLAWLLATQEPKDLEKAKLYAQRAIATDPQMATFHDTLGTIFIELKDWRSAIAELELALAQSPAQSRIKIHAKLARAYEAIGDQVLASLHRERSMNSSNGSVQAPTPLP